MSVVTETAEAVAGTSTAYTMTVGDYFFGTLGTTGDSDWIRIDLTAGQTYTFGLVGVGALTDNLDDSYLRLRNSAGSQIALDDDDGPGRNSSLTFTASSTGTYFLDVQSWNNSEAGDYGLSATVGSKASYDVSMGAGVLLRPDLSWAASPGTAATVTWGIRATGPGPGGEAYDASGNLTPYIVPSAAQIAVAQGVMAMFDGLSGLNFTQVNPGGTTNSATMLFGAYSSGSDGSGAFAYYPGSTAATANAGDVWLNNNSVSQTSLPEGSFSHFAMMHEVGHAVGLAHPSDYNAAPGVSITYANNAQFIEDTHQYTVLSYFDESNTTSSFSSYPDTLLLYDIYALHQQYGANYGYNAGATTYGFNANVGGAYDFTTNTNPVLSIWDGAGTDTLDLSGYAMDQLIDLREGRFSDVGGLIGNLSIAIGAVIENAVGGSGDDTINGNAADNQVLGGAGTDIFGLDLLRSQATVSAISGGYRVVSSLGTDTLIGIEFIRFTDQLLDLSTVSSPSPTIVGTAGNDMLTGSAGADVMDALQGDDTLIGSDGADTMYGQGGTDTISYAASATGVGVRLDGLAGWGGAMGDVIYSTEVLIGSAFKDTLVGSVSADLLQGGGGNDTLWAQGGDDTLEGGDGADTMYGQGGTDTISYAASATGVGVRLDGLAGWGGAMGDVIYSTEVLIGSAFKDTLVGSVSADLLQGGGGNDTLWAQGGDDTLEGGDGADTMYGQGGTDTISYAASATGVGVRLDGLAGWGGAMGDVIYSTEVLIGSAFKDTLVGSVSADLLQGGGGNDTLWAQGGDDTLEGGDGADTMYGQGGADIFVFVDGFGTDTILDFAATNDQEKIDLSGVSTINSFTDLTGGATPRMTQVGADVVIDDFAGNTITLTGVTLSDLHEADFIF